MVLLVEFSDSCCVSLSIVSLRSSVLDVWREESISIFGYLLGEETVLVGDRFVHSTSGVRSLANLAVIEEILCLLQELLVLILESSEFVHGIIANLLQLLLVLAVNFTLDGFPLISGDLWLILWLSPVSLLWSLLNSHHWAGVSSLGDKSRWLWLVRVLLLWLVILLSFLSNNGSLI